jgi:hypothetical protein
MIGYRNKRGRADLDERSLASRKMQVSYQSVRRHFLAIFCTSSSSSSQSGQKKEFSTVGMYDLVRMNPVCLVRNIEYPTP